MGEAIYAAKKPLAAAMSLDKEVKKHTKTKTKKKKKLVCFFSLVSVNERKGDKIIGPYN